MRKHRKHCVNHPNRLPGRIWSTDCRVSLLSTICRLVGPVQSLGKHNELHGGRPLLRPFLLVLLALLLSGRSRGTGRQPRQPAGPHAHEGQHAVLQLQRGAAQHHPHRWGRAHGLIQQCFSCFHASFVSVMHSEWPPYLIMLLYLARPWTGSSRYWGCVDCCLQKQLFAAVWNKVDDSSE